MGINIRLNFVERTVGPKGEAGREALLCPVALHRDEVLGGRARDRGERPLRHPCYGMRRRSRRWKERALAGKRYPRREAVGR